MVLFPRLNHFLLLLPLVVTSSLGSIVMPHFMMMRLRVCMIDTVWLTKGLVATTQHKSPPSGIVAPSSFSHPRPLDYALPFVVAVSGGHQPPSSVVVVVVVDVVFFVVVVALRHPQSLVLSIPARYSDFRRPRSINKHQWARSTPSTSDIPLCSTTRAVSRSTSAAVCFTTPIPPTLTDGARRLPDGWNVQVPSCWGPGQGRK